MTFPVIRVPIWSREGWGNARRFLFVVDTWPRRSGVVSALLRRRGMRMTRSRLLFIILLPALLLAWYVGDILGLEAWIAWLANQPGVTTAFQHPESGRSDALTTLISFSLLTPIALCLLLVILVLLVKALEAVFVPLRVPMWLSTPVVAAALIYGMYTTSPSWLPMSLYALGIVARAYLVYSYGQVPLPH